MHEKPRDWQHLSTYFFKCPSNRGLNSDFRNNVFQCLFHTCLQRLRSGILLIYRVTYRLDLLIHHVHETSMKFVVTGMAFQRKQGIGMKCDSFMKTRRMNQTESYLLEERLKVLDSKRNQKNSEFDERKYSLWKQMEEIKSVRKNLGISVERRKLLRSRGFTIDTRLAQGPDETVTIKKYSMPELSRVGSTRPRSTSIISGSELMMKGLSHLRLQETLDDEKEVSSGGQKDRAKSPVKNRYRVIEPPCRQGSKRNFVQLSSEELKEMKKKEDEKPREDFLDPNLKVDHRGMIMSPKLVKSFRSNSLQKDGVGDHMLNHVSKSSDLRSMSKQLSLQDKQTGANDLTPSSDRSVSLFSKQQASVHNPDLTANSFISKESHKSVILKSRESLDQIAEVNQLDRNSDCQQSVALLVIKTGRNHTPKASKMTRQSHLVFYKRKYGNISPVRNALVEPQNKTNRLHNDAFDTSQQPRSPCNHDEAEDIENNHRRKYAANWQRKDALVRRLTLPPGIFNSMDGQDRVKDQVESCNKEQKRSSYLSQSLTVQNSNTTKYSPHPRRARSNSAVSYAYDARPKQSLCRGYATMQMTIKGKQVKVHIPKFPSDVNSEPVLERSMKKVAEDRLQSNIPHSDDRVLSGCNESKSNN
ncbi:uncharacterized protein [Montipora capricornis]|uniref:uncharacterized protein n=1 Tax=Montipora capricornis TaxID=246305 RepID=UPI0035F154A5